MQSTWKNIPEWPMPFAMQNSRYMIQQESCCKNEHMNMLYKWHDFNADKGGLIISYDDEVLSRVSLPGTGRASRQERADHNSSSAGSFSWCTRT